MRTAEFRAWLKDWLTRHPLVAPPEPLHTSYTEEVMRRIRHIAASAMPWRWLARPRFVFAFSAAVAGILAAVVLWPRAPIHLVRQVERDWQLLNELEELEEQTPNVSDDLEHGFEVGLDDPSVEEWLDELNLLDEAELVSS